MAPKTSRENLLTLARRRGLISAAEIRSRGIHTQAVSRLVKDGVLERVARGHYKIADHSLTEHHGLVIAAVAVPDGVFCLLSALAFHGIGTQAPFQAWIALDRRARRPSLEYPPLRVVRFSGKALSEGIERHVLEGQAVRIYDVAKTLADCFKYRNKIGLDICLEALWEVWRERRATMAEINRFARICRVEKVMAPYLEAVSG